MTGESVTGVTSSDGSRLLFWGFLLVAAGRAFVVGALGAAVAALFAAGATILCSLHLRVLVLCEYGKGREGHGEECELECGYHWCVFHLVCWFVGFVWMI